MLINNGLYFIAYRNSSNKCPGHLLKFSIFRGGPEKPRQLPSLKTVLKGSDVVFTVDGAQTVSTNSSIFLQSF